jgi:hypothetical protein
VRRLHQGRRRTNRPEFAALRDVWVLTRLHLTVRRVRCAVVVSYFRHNDTTSTTLANECLTATIAMRSPEIADYNPFGKNDLRRAV